MTEKWKSYLVLILQFAAWIVGIIAVFVIPPPFDKPEDVAGTGRLTEFIVAFFVILLIIAARFFQKKNHLLIWIIVGCIFLLLGIYALDSYNRSKDICTCKYFSRTVLIGTDLKTPENDKNKRCEDLLADGSGDVSDIWTDVSIKQCKQTLHNGFVGTVPLFMIAIISVLQALFITLKGQDLEEAKQNDVVKTKKPEVTEIEERKAITVEAQDAPDSKENNAAKNNRPQS